MTPRKDFTLFFIRFSRCDSESLAVLSENILVVDNLSFCFSVKQLMVLSVKEEYLL